MKKMYFFMTIWVSKRKITYFIVDLHELYFNIKVSLRLIKNFLISFLSKNKTIKRCNSNDILKKLCYQYKRALEQSILYY